jgi:hypothetical protein
MRAPARCRATRDVGSGNHFVEVQRVARVFDVEAARLYGLREDQVTALIHSGSRGLGHQVFTDYVKRMDAAMRRYASIFPTASSRARPPPRRKAVRPWRRWLRPPTSPGPTARRSPTQCAPRSRGCWGGRAPRARNRFTTSRTTSRRSSTTTDANSWCTEKEPRARFRPDRARFRRSTARSVSPSSSPAAWARRASSSPSSPARSSSRSVAPATAPGRRLSRTGAR